MTKIALVVQRYGVGIDGGAEQHAAGIVNILSKTHDVTVLTSCATDYTTWQSDLEVGESNINGIKTIRFFSQPRDQQQQQLAYRYLKYSPSVWMRRKCMRHFGQTPWRSAGHEQAELSMQWLQAQGPYMPGLYQYIEEHQQQYEVFIFFTSLYYPTAVCLPLVSNKSILVPLLHQEAVSHFPVYANCFKYARCVFFNTRSEMRYAKKLYHLNSQRCSIVGVGMDPVNTLEEHEKSTAQNPYILYIGRICAAKGCQQLLAYFVKYHQTTTSPLRLIMVGNNTMDKVNHPKIEYAGFVSDAEKERLLQNAKALVIPSSLESLSLVTLEAMLYRLPVIAQKKCEVIRDHLDASGSGLLFSNATSFARALNTLLKQGVNDAFLDAGQCYVRENYNWDVVEQKFNAAIEHIASESSSPTTEQLAQAAL